MGLLLLTSYFMFWVLFSCFLSCHCFFFRHTVFEHFILRLLGLVVYGWLFLVANFICYHIVCHMVLIFVLCFGFCWIIYSFGIWIWCFSVFYPVCEFECLSMSEALDCLSYITVFLCCHIVCVLLSWKFFLNIPFSVSYASLSFALFCLYVVFTVLHIAVLYLFLSYCGLIWAILP